MAERLPPTPQRPDWRSLSKNLALWLLVALVAMALFQLMNNQRGTMQEFTYTAFKQQLAAGNVKSVVVFDGKQLEGELSNR
jgi:ATP-dependent Zn protease